MRTVCQRVAIILIFLGCFSTIGHAKQDTYTNWVFDLEQALKKQDLTALSELVKKNPGYSKVWYYGYILDVVTPGVPPKEQTRIRRAGTVIAETLANLPEPQYDAMRMLERLSAPGVDDIAKAIRLGEEELTARANRLDLLPYQLFVIRDAVMARQVFYRSLFRAAKWQGKLGGRDQSAQYVRVAHGLAMGFALARRDPKPWSTIRGFFGEEGFDMLKLPLVDQLINTALDQFVSNDRASAVDAANRALQLLTKTRRDSLMVGLLQNLFAEALRQNQQVAKSLLVKEALLASVRLSNLKDFSYLLQTQLLTDYVDADQGNRALQQAEALVEDQKTNPASADFVTSMRKSTAYFIAEAKERYAEQRIDKGLAFTRLTKRVIQLLKTKPYLTVTGTSATVEPQRVEQTARLAEVVIFDAQMRTDLDDLTEAASNLSEGERLFREELGAEERAFLTAIDRCQVLIQAGRVIEASDVARSVRTSSTASPAARTKAFQCEAQSALLQGGYAGAFHLANAGLRTFHNDEKSVAATVAADLHSIAALTLEAAGFVIEATDRWRYVTQYSGDTLSARSFNAATHRARLLQMAGDLQGALKTIEPFFDSEFGRETAIQHACYLADTERRVEAQASLEVLVPQLTLPKYRPQKVAGLACLAAIAIRDQQPKVALAHLKNAERAIKGFGLLELSWKLRVLTARAYSAAKQWAAATQAFDEAIAMSESLQLFSTHRGLHFLELNLGPDIDQRNVLADASMAVFNLAMTTGKNNPSLLEKAILRDRTLRAFENGVAVLPYQKVLEQRESGLPLRQLWTKKHYLAQRVVGGAISERHRARLMRKLETVSADLVKMSAEWTLSAEPVARAYTERLKPRLSVKPTAYYLSNKESGGIIYDPADGQTPLLAYRLPNRRKLKEISDSINALVAVSPETWKVTRGRTVVDPNYATYRRLRQHATLMVPFVFDKRLRNHSFKDLTMFLNESVMDLPFDALVVDVPRERQSIKKLKGPRFFLSLASPTYLLSEQTAPSMKTGSPVFSLGEGAPEAPRCETTPEPGCVSRDWLTAFEELTQSLKKKTRPNNQSPTALVLGKRTSFADVSAGLPTTIPGELVILGSLSPKEKSVAREVSESWGEMTRRGLNGLLLYRTGFREGNSQSLSAVLDVFSGGRSFIHGLKRWALTQANTPPSIGEEFIAQPGHPYYWARWRRLGVGAPWSRPLPESENPPKAAAAPTVPAGGTESSTPTPAATDGQPNEDQSSTEDAVKANADSSTSSPKKDEVPPSPSETKEDSAPSESAETGGGTDEKKQPAPSSDVPNCEEQPDEERCKDLGNGPKMVDPFADDANQ